MILDWIDIIPIRAPRKEPVRSGLNAGDPVLASGGKNADMWADGHSRPFRDEVPRFDQSAGLFNGDR